ncbi:MAG TPA: CdaR family protein [Thermomicrobiales bacterium]|jgi:YbbR domain-containing protein
MKRAREWIGARTTTADLVRLGSSLVLALLLWGWVTTREDPERTRFYSNVPVQVGELNGNLVVVSAPPNVQIRLRGPRSVMDGVDPADVSAHLNLDGIEAPGSYNVDVVVSAPDGVWDRKSTPARVQIQVEESVAKQFPVVPEVQDEVNPRRRVGQIVPAVSDVTVRGPSSVVARVDRVILPVTIGNQTSDFTGDFTPIAQDKDKQPVTEVTISPATISATVPIEAAGKSVAVFATLVGTPAEGLEVLDRAVIPSTVLVEGDKDVLEGLLSVQTEPVDITGATANVSQRVGIEGLPEGVRVIDPADGKVEVSVQIAQRSVRQELPGLPVEVTNLDPGLKAVVAPTEVAVVVVGSADVLAQLRTEDLTIRVDAGGLGPGVHLLKPTVSVPPNVQWISTDPEMVEVTISLVPTAPLSATPVASPLPQS